MSCSGETVEEENQIIQIKPGIAQQLKKAKYGVSDHSTVELCHYTKMNYATIQKNHSKMEEIVTSTNSTAFLLIDAWNFPPLECIVKIDVCIAGDQWNFMIQ